MFVILLLRRSTGLICGNDEDESDFLLMNKSTGFCDAYALFMLLIILGWLAAPRFELMILVAALRILLLLDGRAELSALNYWIFESICSRKICFLARS